jgi:hypothetical protein
VAAQFLTTSKLSNIISMITLGRQSGILRVLRGQGPTREIGQIKFVEGEPAAALLGQLTGQNALSVLMNWGECIYSFDEVSGGDLDADATLDNSGRVASDPGRYTSQPGIQSGSWPAYGYSNPYSQPLNGTNTSASLPNLGPQSGYPSQTSLPGAGYPSDPSRFDISGPAMPTQIPLSNTPLTPQVLAAVPRRSMLAEHTDQLPLDRRERMLVLLVDGRRSISDLARLTRRTEREVLSVLEHLATLGLVQIGR